MLEDHDPRDANGTPPRFVPPRPTDEQGRLLPQTDEQRRARVAAWDQAVRDMEAIVHETDDDTEAWDEISRKLGVDPETGRGLPS